MAESSLAADLLADFNETDEEDLEEAEARGLSTTNVAAERDAMDVDGDANGDDADEDEEMEGAEKAREVAPGGQLSVDDDEEVRKAKVEKMQLGGVDDVRSVATLMKALEPVLERIAHFQALPPPTTPRGNVEDNPEYKLLVESNAHAVSIDNEIILVHKFIRDHYVVRFPELEGLVQNPLQYAQTVAFIGNNMDIKALEARNGNRLRTILDGPTLMVVTVEATTTTGRELTATELDTVMRGAEMVQALDAAKRTITAYVESRMSIFAPNTSAIIGSQTAAQLINFAGGLRGLAEKPACNIDALGSKRQTATVGLASNIGIRHQGYLYHSPIIREIPPDLKIKAMRMVAAKVILAARVDFSHSSPDGRQGQDLREQVLEKLERLTVPPPNKGPRALPAPDDKPSRKRGGRRARKAKEATAMTDLRKAQNRMAFGSQEEEVGYGASDSTKGLGMIGQQSNGRVRALQVDQRTRARLGKSNAGWAGLPTSSSSSSGAQSLLRGMGSNHGPGLAALGGGRGPAAAAAAQAATGGTNAASGTASSLAFTPFQGIELIDPKVAEQRKRKAAAEQDKWFSSGTFTQVGGGAAQQMAPPPLKKVARGMAPPSVPKK